MIDSKDAQLMRAFEKLLDRTIKDVRTAIRVAPRQSDRDFETTTYNALCDASNGTEFEGTVCETDDMAFPDIIAGRGFGVEVKQTKNRNFITTGNSIFERTRIADIKYLYVVIGSLNDVVWRRYEETLEKIVVTHSPRYSVNGYAKTTVFEKMGVTYEAFRLLDQPSKMDRVRSLYKDRSLWWLSQAVTPHPMRFFSTLDSEEQEALRATAMILCPQIFGESQTKFHNVAVIALSDGIVIPNVRDNFTAGGRVYMRGQEYPQIYKRAVDIQDILKETLRATDIELLEEFWKCSAELEPLDRWEQWKKLVDASNEKYNISDLIS